MTVINFFRERPKIWSLISAVCLFNSDGVTTAKTEAVKDFETDGYYENAISEGMSYIDWAGNAKQHCPDRRCCFFIANT